MELTREGANTSLMLDNKLHLASWMRFSMSYTLTFSVCEFNGKCRSKTIKEIFLARMEAVLSWSDAGGHQTRLSQGW
ncbi:hypothetical protein CF106_01555 [Aeromonas veronii]|nr:hypothetical protein CF106_01555 [Aeromonas veronii]